MTTLYLIRHALPDWTRRDIPYHLPPGPPLTTQGEVEAGQLGAFLRQAGVRYLLSSPLERALRTAQIAAHIAGISYEIQEGLIEWQPGDDEEHVRQRMWPVFEHAWQLSQETGPVGLVSHGGPIGALLLGLGMSADELAAQRVFDHGNPVPTAGAWRAARNGAGSGWELGLAFRPEQ